MMFETMRKTGMVALAAAMTLPAMAQDGLPVEPEPTAFEMPIYTPQWSSDSIAQIANMLSGSWATSQDVAVFGAEGDSENTGVVMNICAAPVAGMSNTLYIESARSDSMHKPFRHAIFELFEYKGEVRLRTYEMAIDSDTQDMYTAIWAQPGYFPELSSDELIATMDVSLSADGAGYAGASPYAYPTGSGGAVEMTSRVELTADRFSSFNTGTDAAGEVAWRANYTFIKGAPKASVSVGDDGMVIVEYANPGEAVADGDQLHIHYAGWIGDGTQFDASRPKGRPFVFMFPPGNRAIVGWGLGMEGVSIGTHRRLIIPGYLGYAERGNPRAGIPGDSTLYFEIECVHIDKPEPVSPGEAQPAEVDEHAGHDHAQPGG